MDPTAICGLIKATLAFTRLQLLPASLGGYGRLVDAVAAEKHSVGFDGLIVRAHSAPPSCRAAAAEPRAPAG
jgi:hypothetical protein